MFKKLFSILTVFALVLTMTGCSKDEENPDKKPANGKNNITIKTVDDFTESQGLIKYFTIEDYKFSIPETVGEYANYLSQLGEVTLNETGKAVDDDTLDAGGISSMTAYLKVETDDGDEQRFYVRYDNPTDKKITVAEATVNQIEVKYDHLSDAEYEKVFDSVVVETTEGTIKMDGKMNMKRVMNTLGDPIHITDGRLDYTDDLGYKYTFDCCNENRNGIFRGFIIKYPAK